MSTSIEMVGYDEDKDMSSLTVAFLLIVTIILCGIVCLIYKIKGEHD
jgi:hypothetical protein